MTDQAPHSKDEVKAFWHLSMPDNKLELSDNIASLLPRHMSSLPNDLDEFLQSVSLENRNIIQQKLEDFSRHSGNKTLAFITHHKKGGDSYKIHWQGETLSRNQDGRPVSVSGHAVRKEVLTATSVLTNQENVLLFSRLMNNLNDSIFFKDLESNFILINEACANKFGLIDPGEAIGKSDFDFFADEHARPAYEDEQQVLHSEKPLIRKIEKEVFQDGSVRWSSTTKLPLYNEYGDLIGTFGISSDITEQKTLEMKLEKSDKQLARLSEMVPGFFFLFKRGSDGNSYFPFASEGIKDIYELTPEDVRESILPVLERVHPKDRDTLVKSIQNSMQKLETWEMDYRVRLPEKGLRWVRGKARPEKQADGTVVGYGYITDITEQKRIYNANVKLRQQFEAIFDSVPNLIFVKDGQGKFIIANKAACNFFGVSQDEIAGKTDRDLGFSQEVSNTFIAVNREVIESGEPFFIPEDKTRNEVGKEIWHQTLKVPFQLVGTNQKAVLTIVTDITERKNRELELNETLGIIGEQNKRLSNFAHIVSHNLRNHAGNITMLLTLYDTEESEEEKEELLAHMRTASDRLNDTISDLNEIIDKQYKKQKELKEVNLRTYLGRIKEILTTEILEHNVKFTEEVPEDLTFHYNPAYLESILLNLISNAIKYRKPGVRPEIEIRAKKSEEEGHVNLTVSDNGQGIDMEKHGQKLFGMYNTFHGNDNSKGIGLFITKNQIESMGGTIHAESCPGEGTTFKIRLK